MSLVSSITSVIFGGWSSVIKYVAIFGVIAALIIGAYVYGHHEGTLAETNVVLTQATKQQQKTITVVQKETVVDTTAVTALTKKVGQLTGTNAKLQAQIKSLQNAALTTIVIPAKITPTTPVTCSLSSDFVKIYNDSLTINNGVKSK